jgi:eukaryotic-like serine/threonine-protein kinase
MSLQTPRGLTMEDAKLILATVKDGPQPVDDDDDEDDEKEPEPKKPAKRRPASKKKAAAAASSARVIGGKYEVIRQLGRGGMGVVYEARHVGTNRRVAVKEIIGEGGQKLDKKLVERFHREAKATGTVETRHIAPILDTGNDPETKNPFLVMELLTGEDLQQYVDRVGPLPEDTALRIVAQACTGLAHAHAAGVVHRDIKPANLFLARRDDEVVVTLLDFGVARVKQELGVESFTLTSTGLMLGTPLYMSPEQVVGAKNIDHRTDLWALGVVLYELIAGSTPYNDHETLGALLVAICSKAARPLREIVPRASERVAAITAKSLALDPAARYPTAEALLADLEAALPGGKSLDTKLIVPAQRRGQRAAVDPAFDQTSPSKQ